MSGLIRCAVRFQPFGLKLCERRALHNSGDQYNVRTRMHLCLVAKDFAPRKS